MREFDYREFTVKGNGMFPIDMLRYDNCWPATSEDAAKLAGRGPREVTLGTRNRTAPTVGRWPSFMWRVV